MKWPDDFKPLRKVEKILQDKIKLFETEKKVDWATGELMAYGSLLLEGKDVRMSGQDVHAVLFLIVMPYCVMRITIKLTTG